MLCDLGLTTARPYRVVGAGGEESFVADASPGVLRMDERNLAVDSVREVIIRDGAQIADLRRRSLLKRLLFLFASSPGKTFAKEEIVETVWNVEYHPLRHDRLHSSPISCALGGCSEKTARRSDPRQRRWLQVRTGQRLSLR